MMKSIDRHFTGSKRFSFMKRSLLIFTAIGVLTASSVASPERAAAQGLIQRLRDRINVQLQNQTRPPAPGTQADPTDRQRTPGAGPQNANPSSLPLSPLRANPSARYRNSPSGADPTDRSGGTPAAGLPGDPGEYGSSVLTPLETRRDDAASIGISGADGNLGRYAGVQVTDFLPHSLADEAGLRRGDFIFMINGTATPRIAILANEIRRYQPGDRVTLRVAQSGVVKDVQVPLVTKTPVATASTPSETLVPQAGESLKPATEVLPPANRITSGIQRASATSEPSYLPLIGANVVASTGQRGVVVKSLTTGNAAGGLAVGDRIISVNGKMVSRPMELASQLSATQPNSTPSGSEQSVIELGVIRKDDLVQLTIDPNAQADAAEQGKPAASGSLLGGFGAMLGAFGGQQASGEKEAEVDEGTDAALPPPKQPEVDVLALEMELPEPTKAETKPSHEDKDDTQKSEIKSEIERLNERLRELEAKLNSDR